MPLLLSTKLLILSLFKQIIFFPADLVDVVLVDPTLEEKEHRIGRRLKEGLNNKKRPSKDHITERSARILSEFSFL